MNIDVSIAGGVLTLRLAGRFDFTTRDAFVARMDDIVAEAPAGEIRVDMSGLDYIDSSGLGMLLMMRDRARKADHGVALVGPRGQVREVLGSARFERLFAIH
jgi:anti-anti-sigma factor